jgi:hypothetical protein
MEDKDIEKKLKELCDKHIDYNKLQERLNDILLFGHSEIKESDCLKDID